MVYSYAPVSSPGDVVKLSTLQNGALYHVFSILRVQIMTLKFTRSLFSESLSKQCMKT